MPTQRPTVKPPAWPACRALVAPKWQWVWDGMIWGSAFWHGGKESVFYRHPDLTGRAAPTAETGASGQHQMHYNRSGIGYDHLNSSGFGTLKVSPQVAAHKQFVRQMTVVWYGSFPLGPLDTSNVGLFAMWNSGPFLLWFNVDTAMRFRTITAAGNSEVISSVDVSSATSPEVMHCFIGTYDGTITRFYHNGEEVGTESTTSTLTTGSNTILINEYQNNTEIAALNNLAMFHNKVWSARQVRDFQVDQYGFLRKDRLIGRVAAAAAARRIMLIN